MLNYCVWVLEHSWQGLDDSHDSCNLYNISFWFASALAEGRWCIVIKPLSFISDHPLGWRTLSIGFEPWPRDANHIVKQGKASGSLLGTDWWNVPFSESDLPSQTILCFNYPQYSELFHEVDSCLLRLRPQFPLCVGPWPDPSETRQTRL